VAVDGKSRFGATTITHEGKGRPLGSRHRLIVWTDGATRSWLLPRAGEITVGRAEDAEICIESAAVSRKHARIHVDGSTVTISDLDSRNSTRVNGERITGRRSLGYGDVITFGDILTILEEETDETDEASTSAPAEEQLPLEGLTLDVGERTITVADPIMLHTYAQIRRLAQSPLSVLIVGETGTGKDLAASALHAWSKRQAGPYVSINCAALPEALAESELFGYERGAFSGADRDKAGLLESACGGTAFLDEIGDLPAPIQPKLLRALEGQKITRLGSVRARAIDVRIVTATNRDLEAAVKRKLFRADLYYRLSAAVIYLPPLRARLRELPLLAQRFLDEACLDLKRPTLTFADGALDRLLVHDWPGNVRQLKNLMGYLAALADGPLTAGQVSAALAKGPPGAPKAPPGASPEARPRRALKEEVERREIESALLAADGNKTLAAKNLAMPLRTFTWKLKRYGLPRRE
jgi:two-component system response regulator AtoC